MNSFKKLVLFSVICFLNAQVSHAWVLILNGTTSSGKTTLAKNFQAKFSSKPEILSIEAECEEFTRNSLEKLGYHYDEKDDFKSRFEKLPEEVRNTLLGNCGLHLNEIYKQLIKKIQKLQSAQKSVIIDTLLYDDAYKTLKNALKNGPIFIVLVYASPDALLKNTLERNNTGNKNDKRELLMPLEQYFVQFFKKCSPSAAERIDTLTKAQFETLCKKLESFLVEKDHDFYQNLTLFINKTFFDSTPPQGANTSEGCIGIAPKLAHDLSINTGIISPAECATTLYTWLTGKINQGAPQ